MHDTAAMDLDPEARTLTRPRAREGIALGTRYRLTARGRAGTLLWVAEAENRVVTAGLNKVLDAAFKSGLASPAWYVGLAGPSIADAAITSGQATLTSASNPWSSADQGRAIIVRGAGAAGADLLTTIQT